MNSLEKLLGNFFARNGRSNVNLIDSEGGVWVGLKHVK